MFFLRLTLHGEIIVWSLCRSFTRNQASPGFVTLMDDLHGIFLVFGFSREGKGIFRFAIRDLVDPKQKKRCINNIESVPV